MTRAAVPRVDAPRASVTRDSATGPGGEGRTPADLRLVGPALAAWAAAAAALTAEGRTVAIACGAAVLVSGVLLLAAAARWRSGRGSAESAGRAGKAGAAGVAGAVAAVLLCAVAGAAVGALAGADTRRGPVPELARRHAEATVEATVTGDPKATRPRVRGSVRAVPAVVVEAEASRVTTTHGVTTAVRTPVLLMAHQPWLGLLPSTKVRVEGRLMSPSRSGDRVAAVVRVGDSGPPQVVAGPSVVQRAAGRLRAGLREATDGLAPDARALLPGLVVGDTSRVPSDLEEAFRTTDLTHLLAVSGGNLAVLLAVLIGPPHLASRAERRGLAARLGIPLRLTALLGGGLALGFVVVCRPEPSVLRAAVCGLITLLAIGTGRSRGLLPALAGAVLLLVLYDPWLARGYGFLLSVLATGALLTLAPRWAAALRRRGMPPRVAEALAAAGAAQAVCAPVIAVLAARVSLVAVPCNLLAEPAVAPATVLGFAALAAAPLVPPLAEGLAWLAGWPAQWTATVARTGAGLPGAELAWPGGWAGGLWLAAATVVVLLIAGRVLRSPWVCGACALLLLLAVVRPAPLTRGLTGWPPPDWRMVACDVGQGDALVLATGPHSAVLVDAGPEPKAIDRCLRRLGVDEVPLLVLSHFHADHVDGLPGVLRGRAVGAIETTPYALPPGQAAFVRREAGRAGVPVVEAVPGERRSVGGLSWEVLWPPPAGTSAVAEDGPNDASVVLLVRTGGLTLLLLGDLEPPAQQELWETHPGLPPVDVLKVAHHGSAYQDPRLTRGLRPRLAVISVGAGNPYGHPAARTIGALREQGAAVLRTDTDGPVAVTGGHGGPMAVTGQRRGRRRRRRPVQRPRRSRTVDGCGALPARGITESCTQRTSTPISVTSTPPARPPPPRRRYGTFSSATSWRCPSRTSRSTSVRRSCWRAGPWWTRWCAGGGEATATSSTARSRSC
ncbi:ComEC/Rec2 family competence protein [Streptomyces hesseae]|uniref:ComEC/Rec2 family competence protein n=1 Tax=Streptomyces hesseae TaxID=3075519 RepID=A0ABU2SRD7_9ACTN|nr:ComEC/Rec2 family competence protein [Streptomyces sp. DSM 40473]MDT0451554.1 ComEC/Rec2 family competence protein [Streptomyces sp. DSM 40473]